MPNRKRVMLNEAGVRAYARLASSVARELDRIIEVEGLKRSDVAQKAGLDKAALTRILDGTRNLELRTIAAVLSAVDHVMDVKTTATRRLLSEKTNNGGRPFPENNASSLSSPVSALPRKAVSSDASKIYPQAATTSYAASVSPFSVPVLVKDNKMEA